jgi:hypothetical protein
LLVLMSLMVPSLDKARQRATLVPCANNLRQLYNLCLTYGSDNAGELPESNSANPATFRYLYASYKKLEKYMDVHGIDPSVWYCPASSPSMIAPWMWGRTDTPANVYKEFRIGYFYTCNSDLSVTTKYKVFPPRNLGEMLNTTNEIIFDIIHAPRPSPVEGSLVPVWSYFPHYGASLPGVCQIARGDGAVMRRRVEDLRLRYSYIAPTECYW